MTLWVMLVADRQTDKQTNRQTTTTKNITTFDKKVKIIYCVYPLSNIHYYILLLMHTAILWIKHDVIMWVEPR